MPGLEIHDPAERFDLAYLYANSSREEIAALANEAHRIGARASVVHVANLRPLVQNLGAMKSAVRPEVVINFPEGANEWQATEAEARQAHEEGAAGADLVVNLAHIENRNWDALARDCARVRRWIPEMKLIAQVPYLWSYPDTACPEADAIATILEWLPEAGVYCLKDWTGKDNFSKAVDFSPNARVQYIDMMANYIVKHNLRLDGKLLLIKVAGQVDPANARDFVNAGADLLGLSYQKARAVRETLL